MKNHPTMRSLELEFQIEDRWARDFLVQHSKDKRNDIGFTNYSVQNPFDSSWKTNARARIARTKGTIVLIWGTTCRQKQSCGRLPKRFDRRTSCSASRST